MEENKEQEKNNIFDKVCEQVEKKIEEISKVGIQQTNIDYLGKLVDVKKDIAEINYTEKEEENMMYRGYDNYGRGSYGNYDNYNTRDRRYNESGNYGARGYDMKYRGHDMIEDMSDNYGAYMGNRESGRYGSPEMSKAFDYMLKSAKDFFKHLMEEATSQEEIEKIRRTAREISEM